MSEIAIRIKDLHKRYGAVVALDGVSFEVRRGKIFGLLGPNGAGKTTLVKILTTLVRPDRGEAQVAGLDVSHNPVGVRNSIGYVPQEVTVDPYLTVVEHLRYYADLYHLSAAVAETRIKALLDLLDLTGYEKRRARHLSGGMKRKLDLACGLIHEPGIILLDEPSLGLDVHVRHEVWRYINTVKGQGKTVFLCTNYMEEAERLCDQVAIIDKGKIATVGNPAFLKSQLKQDVISIEIARSAALEMDHLGALEKLLSGLDLVKGTLKDGTHLKIYVERGETALPNILRAASSLTIPIQSITHSQPGLDEVFLHYTGHALARTGERHG